jgi:hypothetical protein
VDIIEHLEKDEGMKLLKCTENIARSQVVIFTPYGILPQSHPDGKDAWGLNGCDWQQHKSGWLPEDFDSSYEILPVKISIGLTIQVNLWNRSPGIFGQKNN